MYFINGSKISLKTYPIRLWSKYKSVALLWAAWQELAGDSQADLEALRSNCNHSFYHDFFQFLALAEYFRRFGEGTKTPRGHKERQTFVLDTDETGSPIIILCLLSPLFTMMD